MKFIQLTNAADAHRGRPIAIRDDLVHTVHTDEVMDTVGQMKSVTYIYCPPHGTWEVTESFEEVMRQIQDEPKTRSAKRQIL